MSKIKIRRKLLPLWNMPSDPVRAVVWVMYWLLRVAVNFFWLPILLMVIFETYLSWSASVASGLISGIITLLVGLGVWAVLYGIVFLINIGINLSQVFADAQRIRQSMFAGNNAYPFGRERVEDTVVEGTISELDEEQQR